MKHYTTTQKNRVSLYYDIFWEMLLNNKNHCKIIWIDDHIHAKSKWTLELYVCIQNTLLQGSTSNYSQY